MLFFGGFGVWAALAPIDSAAIAPGSVRIDSNRKTVQHLEGGIVAAILVRDGDVVRAGQELVRLDDTRAKATLELLKGRYLAARALEARLIAERDGRAEITFPAILRELGDEPNVIEATRGQTNIFRARQRALAGQSAILRQRIAVLREEIAGIRGKIAAQAMQMHLIKEEIKDVRGLYKKGLAKRARLLALERGSAKIEGDRSENRAKIARAGQQIAEADLRISELGTTLLNDVVQELRDVQTELFGVAERIRTAEDVFSADPRTCDSSTRGWRCQTPEHDADHGETDEGDNGSGITLEVAGEAPVAADPGERSLHDPAFRQDHESVRVGALNDFQLPAAGRGDGRRHPRPLVAAVGEDGLDEGERTARGSKQLAGAVAILHVGGMDDDAQQQAECIDEDVALAPRDLLARIEALRVERSPPFCAPLALWLSITAADGLASRPSRSRTAT